MKNYYVYILTNCFRGVLYVGVTNSIEGRTWKHKNEIYDGFSKKYKTQKLVYYEIHQDIREAIKREKLIKKWKREWKIELIEKDNPKWEDLGKDWS